MLTAATKRFRILASGLVFALLFGGAYAAGEPTRFESVDSFIGSLSGVISDAPQGDALSGAYGDLTGLGRRDWAGLLPLKAGSDTEQLFQLFILTQDADGTYQLAAKSPPSERAGLEISKHSLFVRWDHGDSKGTENISHQFKLYDGKWRLIGATFHFARLHASRDENGELLLFDDADVSTIDHNMLTGEVIVGMHLHGKRPVKAHLHMKPKVMLLDEVGTDSQAGWLPEFDKYAL